MGISPPIVRAFALWAICLLGGAWLLGSGVALGQSAAPNPNAPQRELFPGDTPVPLRTRPLSGTPWVISLAHREPGQMSPPAAATVSSLRKDLQRQAELHNFNIEETGWEYRQIVCPSFPDYVLLAFRHGPDPSGSSRFVAVLSSRSREVRIVSSYAHGFYPFEPPLSRSATREVFNRMLLRERGSQPLNKAPNWLVIGLCYAELNGYSVQALAGRPQAGESLDRWRLDANGPQIRFESDNSAEITFSDLSAPQVTRNWSLRFNRRGQLVSAAMDSRRQPARIALHP